MNQLLNSTNSLSQGISAKQYLLVAASVGGFCSYWCAVYKFCLDYGSFLPEVLSNGICGYHNTAFCNIHSRYQKAIFC